MHVFALETHPRTVSLSPTFRSVATSEQAQQAQRELRISRQVHTRGRETCSCSEKFWGFPGDGGEDEGPGKEG